MKIPTLVWALCLLLVGCNPAPQDLPHERTSSTLPTTTSPAISTVQIQTPSPSASTTASPFPPTPTPNQSANISVRITIIYDNYLWDQHLTSEWGFGALVEAGEHTILFDTGGSGETFLNNLNLLEIDPEAVEAVVISHAHGDHFGGLLAFLEIANSPRVFLPASFSASFKERVSGNADLVEVTGPVEIVPGIFSTGILTGDGVDEQGLVIDMGSELVILTGCAHPGIVQMVQRGIQTAAAHSGGITKPVALVAGGFHLMSARSRQVESIILDLKDSGVKEISPTHCTGDAAITIFAEGFGDDYLPGGAGRVFNLP